MLRFLLDLLLRWFRSYVEHLVCLHFCAFRRAGSALKYTHVHVLGNPRDATGLGHDDETSNDDPGHVSVSDGSGCTVSAESERTVALRRGYVCTAYFHEAREDESCEEGFVRIRCMCRNAEGVDEAVWVCYTLDHPTFERWYDEQKWPNRTGRYELRATHAATVPEGKVLACPSTLVLQAFAIRNVPACAGFGGVGDGENALVVEARSVLQAASDRIRCDGCQKTVTETFRGWRCGQERPTSPWVAEAKVQWTVTCQ